MLNRIVLQRLIGAYSRLVIRMSLFRELSVLKSKGDGLDNGLVTRLIRELSKLRGSKGDSLRILMFRRLSKLIDRTGVVADRFIFLVD